MESTQDYLTPGVGILGAEEDSQEGPSGFLHMRTSVLRGDSLRPMRGTPSLSETAVINPLQCFQVCDKCILPAGLQHHSELFIPATSRLKKELRDLQLHDLLMTASQDPPITQEILSELELPSTINNDDIRHNLNFEPNSCFWPTWCTKLGQGRRNAAKEYWAALEIELMTYMGTEHQDVASSLHNLCSYGPLHRLSRLFMTLKAMLQSLLCEEQALAMDELLDVSFLMQQVGHGVCDLVKFGDWLATVLKSSCSPQRDHDVTTATDQLKKAAEDRDASLMVTGIESVFAVLEVMKLVRTLLSAPKAGC